MLQREDEISLSVNAGKIFVCTIGNQQPSSEQEKVQRLSRRGVELSSSKCPVTIIDKNQMSKIVKDIVWSMAKVIAAVVLFDTISGVEINASTRTQTVTKINLETKLSRHGSFLEYSDEVELFSEDSVKTHYYQEMGYAANQMQDDLLQMDMLNLAGVTLYAGGHSRISDIVAGDLPTFNLLRTATKQLSKNLAKKHTKLISGSVKVDTKTVAAGYFAFIGPDMRYVLETLTDGADKVWVPAYKYAAAGNLADGEEGAIHETRFIQSTRMMMYAQGASPGGTLQTDVYPILYVTDGSFATVGLQGKGKISFKGKAPGVPTVEDPYGLRGLYSFNFFYAGIALRPEGILKILAAIE
jgi:N4-gp56 family major capsid protein